MSDCIYTETEIIDNIKEINLQLMDADIENETDTSQSRHKNKRSPAQVRKSLENWKDLLYQCYPDTYAKNYGSNIMQVTSVRRY